MTTALHETLREPDLIYDVGMHLGEDTDFYLKKGFRVVAFEANPELVAAGKLRFAEAIANGRLTLVEGAIIDTGGTSQARTTTFYVNNDLTIWGTAYKSWAERNDKLGHGSRAIEVPVVDLERIFLTHGIPHYLKVDIEGCDMVCLRMLTKFQHRPAFISLESDKTSMKGIKTEITTLVQLGYERFQAVEQSSVPAQRPPFPAREGTYADHRFELGSSGLFGAELAGWTDRHRLYRRYRVIRLGYVLLGDAGLMKRWHFPGAGTLRRLVRTGLRAVTHAPVPGWYDTHACHADASATIQPAAKSRS